MSRPYADCDSGETCRGAVQYGLCFHGDPAGHGTGGVVRATRVGIQSILMKQERNGEDNTSCSRIKQPTRVSRAYKNTAFLRVRVLISKQDLYFTNYDWNPATSTLCPYRDLLSASSVYQ